jgi:hypothetical protein
MIEAVVPVAVAAPEGEDLSNKCNQRMKPRFKKKREERKLDKPRFPNTHVETFGWRGGATWSRNPLGPGH